MFGNDHVTADTEVVLASKYPHENVALWRMAHGVLEVFDLFVLRAMSQREQEGFGVWVVSPTGGVSLGCLPGQ